VDLVKRAKRDEIWLVALDPVTGAESRKTRPCVVISPDELNGGLLTVIVAPLTSTSRPYPFRVTTRFQNKLGQVALDQMRAVSILRLVRKLGKLAAGPASALSDTLTEMFQR
jgi:mRNA interferase MazF